ELVTDPCQALRSFEFEDPLFRAFGVDLRRQRCEVPVGGVRLKGEGELDEIGETVSIRISGCTDDGGLGASGELGGDELLVGGWAHAADVASGHNLPGKRKSSIAISQQAEEVSCLDWNSECFNT